MDSTTSPETRNRNKDLIAENIEKLKQLFPEAVCGGKVNFTVLKQLFGEAAEKGVERFEFTWPGKELARQEAYIQSNATLRPCPAESVNWANTGNIFIEGDNLEVLKLLQNSYQDRIKMIYIDPPYNTGKDFVYKDNYKDNLRNYLEITGQTGKTENKEGPATEFAGRYHASWLNMMYPRLKLARNLLREDGAIFISIDDSELENLKKMCNEIFGENNFLAHIVWERAFSPVNLKSTFSPSHDFILCYAKNALSVDFLGLKRTSETNSRYKNPDNDPRGPWTSGDLSVGPRIEEKVYSITTPGGRLVYPPSGYCWRFTEERIHELIADNRIWFGVKGNNVPRLKRFLSETNSRITPMTIWKRKEVGDSQSASRNLKALFDGISIFDYPKPVELVRRMAELVTRENDLVLDFFSGTSTTAHAVMELNKEDGGNRKFILVQLPEPIKEKSEAYKAGYKTIADIGKDRIRRVIAPLKEEAAETKWSSGLGFRVFKLESSHVKEKEDAPDQIFPEGKQWKQEDRWEEDVLFEILLKNGKDLSLPIKKLSMAGQTVYSIGKASLLVCLEKEVSLLTVEAMMQHKEEMSPKECTVILGIDGFKNSVEKTKALQFLQQLGIEIVHFS